ncbi:hypothetical protein Pan258_44270 [Symmachiella dynata]|nr:hypothetical protein Pan258_44270 [Symmachiella dynata]
MQPLNWNDIYRVSEKRRVATQAEMERLREVCGVLPVGYQEFISEFGFGEFDSILVMRPEDVFGQINLLRESLAEWRCMCQDFDQPVMIPEQSVEDGVPLARTDWGDYYFCTPSDPGVLRYIWRGHDSDSNPSVLPLGFLNPFIHREENQEPEELGQENLVFDAFRDVFKYHVHLSGPKISPDAPDTLAILTRNVLDCLGPNKVVEDKEIRITTAYVKRFGAEVDIGFRARESQFYIFAHGDFEEESNFIECLAKLKHDGYAIDVVS